MQNSYLAKLFDGRLVSIYNLDKRLSFRIWENGRWLKENIFLDKAQHSFTAGFSEKKELRIFAQNESGGIVLISFDGENISRRTILENNSNELHTILFHSLESEKSLSLLYNIPMEENKQKLIIQTLNENGKWGEPVEITTFLPLPDRLFEMHRISRDKVRVFYRAENNRTGFREITSAKTSEFVPIQRHTENIHNYSFLSSTNILHTLCIINNLFSSKLIYRKKISTNFEAPMLIWEGQGLENCLLIEIKSIIYAFFQYGGILYVSKSENNGDSFGKPEIYKHKFCRLPVKSTYITAMPDKNFNANNIFVDKQCPWDIQIISDIYEDFFIFSQKKDKTPPPTPEPSPRSISSDDISKLELITEHMERLSAQNRDYRNEIASLKNIIEQKEKEALETKNQIKSKNKLIGNLKSKIKKLQNT